MAQLATHPFTNLAPLCFQRGEQLPSQKAQIWQIIDGYVRSLTWTAAGELVTIGIWGRDDCIGPGISQIQPYCLECLTPVKAIVRNRSTETIPERLLDNLQQTEQLLVICRQRSVPDRLRALFTWLVNRFGQPCPHGQIVEVGLTHQQFAELVGTTRVTISRLLPQLEQAGWINSDLAPEHRS